MTTSRTNNQTQLDLIQNLVQERIEFFHITLNERLALKDRWITDRFTEEGKRVDALIDGVRHQITDLKLLLEAEMKADHDFMVARFDMGQKRFEDYAEASKRQGQLIVEGHMSMHAIMEKSHEEFKISVQQRIDALGKVLDTLREERGLFVLRDSHDAQIDALEKQIDAFEKQFTEKIELSVKQVRDSLDARIQQNVDRLTKLENNLSVMNARNQQSIIALGILLTLVEIIVRFYNK